MSAAKLPSWRPGPTREAIEAFLEAAEMLPIEQRVAAFDVDGTLWSEKPQPTMQQFLIDDLRAAAEHEPTLGQRPEYRAALDGDAREISRLGGVNVILALFERYAGTTPEAFAARVSEWFERARQPDRSVAYSQTRYRPMLELIGELRARHFGVYAVSGSGVDFLRAVSGRYFGIPPEGVVGSQASYELTDRAGVPELVRTRELLGDPNEGAAKLTNLQRIGGRRPILAAGNSPGDAQLLEYALASDGPSLALLVDHDDGEREYRYQSESGVVDSSEPITAVATRQGWTVVSMQNDWGTIFADR